MVTERAVGSLPGWLVRQYPFSTRFFRTPGGARLSYVDEGPPDGEAVLMLHGNPTWSFYYRDLIRDLCPQIRCVAPDHVGMGLSEKPAGYTYSLESRIADIDALVNSLGLQRVHLVVHDWGGAIGFGLATRKPERIGRIVILNTAAFASDRIPWRISVCRTPYLGAFLVRGINGFADPATWMTMASRRLSPEERRGYLYPYGNWSSRIGIHRFIRDIPLEAEHPSRPVLDAITANLGALSTNPKLILWGCRDFCFDEWFLNRWREIYPDATAERLTDLGHYVLEDGGAPVRKRIQSFLRPNSK